MVDARPPRRVCVYLRRPAHRPPLRPYQGAALSLHRRRLEIGVPARRRQGRAEGLPHARQPPYGGQSSASEIGLRGVQKVLRHKQIETTTKYTHVNDLEIME